MPPSRLPAGAPHLLDASSFWSPTSAVRRVLTARQATLPELGWRHTVLAPGAQGEGMQDSGGLPLPWSGGERMPWGRQRLTQLIEKARPDLIEVADPYTMARAALEAGQRLGVPTIAFCHSNLPALAARLVGGERGVGTRRGLWAAQFAKSYLSDLYAGFDMVLAPSLSMVRRLQRWGLRQVHCQPLGVDCRVFNPQAADPMIRRQIERHLDIPAGTRLVVYTGRFAPEKNLDVLARAVDRLGNGHLLLAVGAGPRPPHGRRVRTLPPLTDSRHLARLLANADVYAHAGDHETFGLGALEAMACGVPVVLSAADGLGELASAGGVAVSGSRTRDWAEALASVLRSDPTDRCTAALAHAHAHDWGRVVDRMVQRYQRLLLQEARLRTAYSTPLSQDTPSREMPQRDTAPGTMKLPSLPGSR